MELEWEEGRLTRWITEKQTHDSEGSPFVDLGDIYHVDVDQERQSPDLSKC